ncbi:V-type ATP synthase subunit D [candidate division TA06 bacterium B3_TA06]|uniref:V-type ATP synthase subunit D n=1 Tax=candidate division TA06 bacterium B3_TA06 TaxID=2012487 RepID=A0A532USU7_UNCT6|nr:MAG: V-type ATP synthase subunit D [candidate division TA06 bacterium B3_TA06]
MRLNVNATRMELLKLRRRLAIAERGYKLLKDKLEELMRNVYSLVDEIRDMRREVEASLRKASARYALAKAQRDRRATDIATSLPAVKLSIEAGTRRILNVKVPIFKPKLQGRIRCYGFLETSGELDLALQSLYAVLEKMVLLAEKEKALELLASEIERTRRRVNALEYVVIPNTAETISFIKLKLSEMERGNLTRLMRIKEIIRG